MADFDQQGESRGIIATISGILNEVFNLIRGEFALARAEIGEKVSGLLGAVIMLMVGLALIIAALGVLLDALVFALAASGIHPGWSAFIIGVGTAVVGGVLIMVAKARFKPENLLPEKTAGQLRKDSETLKEVGK